MAPAELEDQIAPVVVPERLVAGGETDHVVGEGADLGAVGAEVGRREQDAEAGQRSAQDGFSPGLGEVVDADEGIEVDDVVGAPDG